MSYDLLIKGGTVVDGSGDDRFRADVAIDSDRIVGIGENLGPAKRTINAEANWSRLVLWIFTLISMLK